MAWTGGVTRSSGVIVSASMWNAHLGAGGDLDHLHVGNHIVIENLSYQSADVWQFANNYQKILMVTFNGIVLNPDASTHYTESAVNQITFTAALKAAMKRGQATSGTDKVTVLYIKSE